jgi:HEAT repeat protein
MTNQTTGDFPTLIEQLSRGDVPIADLPLDSDEFWLAVFQRAAHPGRSKGKSRLAAGSEMLLHRSLRGRPASARRQAAAQALQSTDAGTRREAIRIMHEIEPDAAMLEAASQAINDNDGEVRIEAVRLIAKYPSSRTLPALIDLLGSAFDVRETIAAEAVVGIGAPAVPGLNSLLEHDDARIRWRAARCLSKIAENGDAKTLKPLLKAFHDDSPDVAWVAADGLLALGPDVSVQVLRSALSEPLTPVTSRALHHYADHASPRRTFQPLIAATRGSATGSATLTAIEQVLKTLEGGK